MNYTEYKAIPNSNKLNLGLSIVICAFVGVILGWLYCIIVYIPIIYLSFILTLIFAFALGFSVQIVSKFFKITDKKTKIMIVIITTVFAYYSHWISFVLQTYTQTFPSFSSYIKYWIFSNQLLDNIVEINKLGTWSFLSTKAPVNGMLLSLIWFAEALILFFVAIAHVFRFPENPFSQKLNKWYPKLVLHEEFTSIGSPTQFILKLKEQGIDLILNLERGLAYKYAKISIFYLEGEDKQYLSIDAIFIERNNGAKENVTEVVKPIEINTTEAKKLISKFGTKKEFFLDF